MDEFQALLAKRSEGTVAAPPEDEDEFSAVLAKRGKPGTPAATPAGQIPRDTSLKAPPAVSQDANTLGKLVRGQGVVETAADLGDIVLGGVPAAILGSLGEVTQRVSSLTDGRGYRKGGKAGAEFSRSMGEKFGRPLFDALSKAGLIDPKTRSVPMQAMDKIGGWLEHAATVFEADTGLPREDYLASINGFMAAMGVKGAQAMTQGALSRAKARGTKSAWDTALERMDAEEQLARGSEAEGAAAKLTTPVADAAKIRLMARPEVGATRTREQARKDARAAFSTQEAGDQAGLVDRQAGYREELAAQRAVLQDRFPPSGERTGSRDAVDLTLTGKGTPVTYTDNQLGVVHPSPLGTGKRLDVVPRPPLETALEKVRGGRLFDMTMEERLAVRNSVDITDPKVITAAAVGATGLGLAMAYEPSAEEAAMVIGAGALLRRGGKGETVRELMARPEATPLGALLEASAYTTSTLEKLADQSPGTYVFKKSTVEQLLKREGVTAHERKIMQNALDEVPGDKITAKELMVGVKSAIGDFELEPVKSNSYANYGLDRIDREAGVNPELAEELNIPVEPDTATTRIYRSPLELGSNNHFQDPNYFAHTRSFTEDGVRHVVELQSDLAQKAGKVLKPEERANLSQEKALYDRLSLVTEEVHSTVNDTRSTLDDYIAALNKLEAAYDPAVWPDVKLRIGKLLDQETRLDHEALKPAVRDKLNEFSDAGEFDRIFDLVKGELGSAGRQIDRSHLSPLSSALEYALYKETTRLNAHRAEVGAKLGESGVLEPISPMLKDWHKRLVREEIADAERARGETQNLIAEKQRAISAFEAELRATSSGIPQDWVGNRSLSFRQAAGLLRKMSEGLREEKLTEQSVKDKMLRIEAQLDPEARAKWKEYYENYADETEGFLRPTGDEVGAEWGQKYAAGFSDTMADFFTQAVGKQDSVAARGYLAELREDIARLEGQRKPAIRFATADTVAKVEGWTDVHERIADSIAQNESNLTSHKQTVAALEAIKRGEVPDDPYYYGLRTADPEGFQSVVKNIEAELAHAREALAASEERLARAKESWAGQTRFSKEHQGIYDRYSRDVEKFLRQLGGKPYTDSAGHTWLEVPLGEQQKALPGGGARTQIGGVDPALAKAVGLVGGSTALAAWLSRDKDRVKHAGMTALLTGLGLLLHSRVPAISKMVTDTIQGVQNLVGNLSTDKAISAPLLRRLTSHAEEEMRGVHDSGKRIAPFLEIVDRLPEVVKRDLDAALSNGRTSDIVAAVGKAATPGLLKAWNEVQAELKSLGNKLIEVKGLKELRPDYFPRIVKDLPGLMNAIGKEFSTPLQQALAEAERKAGGFLDEAGRAQVVNTFIEKNLRASTVGGKPSFFKRRTLGDVTVDLAPYYVEPSQALPLYIGSAVRAIEKAKFFGKELVRDDGGRPNLEASIGNIVAREIEAGNITPENFTRLTDLLRTRFGPAYQSPARGLQSLSQLTNIALLGNVFSGLMNVADVGAIAAQHGMLPLVAAVTKQIRGTAKLRAADVGMADAIGAEFVYGTRDPIKLRIPLTERTVQISLAKALDKTFKLSGFKALDTIMKETNLNAALEKYSRLARTKSGEARILRQYGDYFTTDMPALLADLRSGAKTKLTTELAFRELSNAQPTTKIEMPKFYLDHPNLRFGYALKSFMIKQMNFVKKRGIDEIRKGNVREGSSFLIRYALMAGAAGATMDWIVKSLLGRDADLDWKSIPLNALKNLGLSEYVIDKARQGKGKEAILAATVPPADPILNIVTADPQAVRYFPLVGRLVYDRFMDGAEKANAAKKLAEKRKAADAHRTPEERRALEQRALERRKELVRERE